MHRHGSGPLQPGFQAGKILTGVMLQPAGSSDVGILSVYPAVKRTVAASPIPLPTARRIAVIKPGISCRSNTFVISYLVAPSDNNASGRSRGSSLVTSSSERIIIGIISIATVIIPPSSDALIPRYTMRANPNAP